MFEADSHSIEVVLNIISEKESGDKHGRPVVPVGNFGAVPVEHDPRTSRGKFFH